PRSALPIRATRCMPAVTTARVRAASSKRCTELCKMSSTAKARVAAITGGAGGIGSVTGARLRAAGWQVAVLDRDMDLARKVAEEIGGVAYEIDLADRASIRAAAEWVETNVGPVEALACVAAHLENPHKPQNQDDDEWDSIVKVNLTG